MVKNILWKCNLHIFNIDWVKSCQSLKLMVAIKLWCLFSLRFGPIKCLYTSIHRKSGKPWSCRRASTPVYPSTTCALCRTPPLLHLCTGNLWGSNTASVLNLDTESECRMCLSPSIILQNHRADSGVEKAGYPALDMLKMTRYDRREDYSNTEYWFGFFYMNSG